MYYFSGETDLNDFKCRSTWNSAHSEFLSDEFWSRSKVTLNHRNKCMTRQKITFKFNFDYGGSGYDEMRSKWLKHHYYYVMDDLSIFFLCCIRSTKPLERFKSLCGFGRKKKYFHEWTTFLHVLFATLFHSIITFFHLYVYWIINEVISIFLYRKWYHP